MSFIMSLNDIPLKTADMDEEVASKRICIADNEMSLYQTLQFNTVFCFAVILCDA